MTKTDQVSLSEVKEKQVQNHQQFIAFVADCCDLLFEQSKAYRNFKTAPFSADPDPEGGLRRVRLLLQRAHVLGLELGAAVARQNEADLGVVLDLHFRLLAGLLTLQSIIERCCFSFLVANGFASSVESSKSD